MFIEESWDHVSAQFVVDSMLDMSTMATGVCHGEAIGVSTVSWIE